MVMTLKKTTSTLHSHNKICHTKVSKLNERTQVITAPTPMYYQQAPPNIGHALEQNKHHICSSDRTQDSLPVHVITLCKLYRGVLPRNYDS